MFTRLYIAAASKPWKPEFWLEKAGKGAPYAVAAILFAESGLFFGFFLPGDSLLFLSGFFASDAGHDYVAKGGAGAEALSHVVDGMHQFPFPVMLAFFFVAAVAGDQVGYLFGKKVGPALFSRPDSKLFRQEHVAKAHAFLEHHGPKTIVLARFVPIVRTFAPIVAGVGKMRYRTFVAYNLLGGFLWAVGVTTLGYFLGRLQIVRDHVETAILIVIFLSLLPVFIEVVKSRRHKKAAAAAGATPAVTADGTDAPE